jgi:hypothetical protein
MRCVGVVATTAIRGPRLAGVLVVFLSAALGNVWPQAGPSTLVTELEGKLTPSDAAPVAHFGFSVDISGDSAIVGAPRKNAAYVFVRDHAKVHSWHEVARIPQPCPEYQPDGVTCRFGFGFGVSVAIDGDLAIVGASADDPALQGGYYGAAYIYARDEGGIDTWGQVAKLAADDPVVNAELGQSVSIDGDTAIAGAWTPTSLGRRAASGYVFSRDHGGTGAWGQLAKLTASVAAAPTSSDRVAVSLSKNTAVIGDVHARAAFLFSRHPVRSDRWPEVAKLMPADVPTTCSQGQCRRAFGLAVSISGDTVVVGDPSLNDGEGAAYVFVGHGRAHRWREVARLKSRETVVHAHFGIGVDVVGDFAIIGALSDAAYVFERDRIGRRDWRERARFSPADVTPSVSKWFGNSVSMSGNTGLVGALLDADHGLLSGAAYACEITGPIPASAACRRQQVVTAR